jgi:cell division septation protein DedD
MAEDHPTGENPPGGSGSPEPDQAAERREVPEPPAESPAVGEPRRDETSAEEAVAVPGPDETVAAPGLDETVAVPGPDETVAAPGPDETVAVPAADETAVAARDRPPPPAAWSGRAPVPPPDYHGGGTDQEWTAEEPQPGPWWLPVALGLLALVILGVLAAGVWLIADSLQDNNPAPVQQTSTSPSPTTTGSPTSIPSSPAAPPTTQAPTRSPAPPSPTPTPIPAPSPTGLPGTPSPPPLSPTGP